MSLSQHGSTFVSGLGKNIMDLRISNSEIAGFPLRLLDSLCTYRHSVILRRASEKALETHGKTKVSCFIPHRSVTICTRQPTPLGHKIVTPTHLPVA